jgi:8-oxo-dGTP pyrophosphatase MutT (NUDIX family)
MNPRDEPTTETDVRRGAPVEKVTAFVLGRRAGVEQLLVLYHPTAGIQLPAGTVEAGESARVAALREAHEETGIEGLVWGGLLGEERMELAPEQGIVALPAPTHTRPDASSHCVVTLRRGLWVVVVRAEGDFLQVRYVETDRYPDPQFTSFELLGWVPAGTIASVVIRHFAWMTAPDDTPSSWVHYEDHHHFTLRWHPLDRLPSLVAPQAPWLRFLAARVKTSSCDA